MADSDDFSDSDALQPDEVTPGGGSGPAGDGSTSGGLDQLAQRAVDSVLHLVRRANALAGGVLMFVVVAGVGGFALGLAALSGGMRTVWIVVGGFFLVLSIVSVVTAMWRLRGVRRSADALVTEVRTLISGNGTEAQTIVETVTITEERSGDGIVDLSREFVSIQGAVGDRVGQFRSLTSAMTAVTTFPGLVALATLIGFVFLGLSPLFAIALLL